MDTSVYDEDLADSMEDHAEYLRNELLKFAKNMKAHPGHVRPSVVSDLCAAMPSVINACAESGEELGTVEEAFHEFRSLEGKAMGHLLTQWVPHPTNFESFHKRSWFDVAEVMGPDNCQILYHAAVFTTKVA